MDAETGAQSSKAGKRTAVEREREEKEAASKAKALERKRAKRKLLVRMFACKGRHQSDACPTLQADTKLSIVARSKEKKLARKGKAPAAPEAAPGAKPKKRVGFATG